MLTYVGSLIVFVFLYLKNKSVSGHAKKMLFVRTVFILGLLLALALTIPSVSRRFESFWRKDLERKGAYQKELISDMTLSRSENIETMLASFKESPIIGNGFQVTREMQYYTSASFQILLSAPVEKGILYLLILEEGGLIGMLLFVLFVLKTYQWGIKYQENIFLGSFFAMLILNAGEATFFSSSAIGGFLWMLCFLHYFWAGPFPW